MAADPAGAQTETTRPMRFPSAHARALLALPAALLLAVGAAVVPPAIPSGRLPVQLAIPVVRAADGIVVTSETRYVVDPAAAVVHATVTLIARNVTPDSTGPSGTTRYYFDGVNVGVQPDAVRLGATQDGLPVRVTAVPGKGYQLVTVAFRGAIYFDETARLELSFDLPAGGPRSTSDVRVGLAFASFLAWSFGDTGTIRIEVPPAFTTDITGANMARSIENGAAVFSATTTDALDWFAWVNARNDAGLTRQQLDIPGGEQVVVRAWPEDGTWRGRVSTLLTGGVPALATRIGLPWPVTGPLNVLEIHTPLLEGYGGFFNSARTEITVSEDLDALTIVHEASHAWFNETLFSERWIDEGLADEYAAQVLGDLGEPVTGLRTASRSDPFAFALEDWPPPSAIRDSASSSREDYGYAAAYTVIHEVAAAAGEAGMRRVFQAAHDHTTAYVGAGAPEPAALPNDWRRFLDLVEELGGATGTADLLATWALPPDAAAQLAPRATAVAAYRALLADSGGRAAPWAVRAQLDSWTFDAAVALIAEAERVVARIDALEAEARSVGEDVPTGLELGYAQANDQGALDGEEAFGTSLQAPLDALAGAIRAGAESRDWLTTVGLLGSDPDAELAAARLAWGIGNLNDTTALAGTVQATLGSAPRLGRERVALAGGAAAALVLLLLLIRVRGRRRTARERADRYATLPASVFPEVVPGASLGLDSRVEPEAPIVPPTDTEQGADRS